MIVAVAAMSFVCCGGNASKTAEAEAPVEAVAEEAAAEVADTTAAAADTVEVAEEAAEAEVVAAE